MVEDIDTLLPCVKHERAPNVTETSGSTGFYVIVACPVSRCLRVARYGREEAFQLWNRCNRKGKANG